MEGKRHRVRQGETIPSIAAEYGFDHWKRIWEDSGNAELRSLRKRPEVLAPGDDVWIPARATKDEDGATNQRHRFRRATGRVFLRIRVIDSAWDPVASEDYTIAIGDRTIRERTNAEGILEQTIPAALDTATLVIRGHTFVLKIGHLDPVDVPTGQNARLNNLGYNAGRVEGPEEDASRSAVEEYQVDHELRVDGRAGSVTQSNLQKDHGC